MKVTIGSKELEVEVLETKTFKSPYTNNTLYKYEISFIVKGTQNNTNLLELKNKVNQGHSDLIIEGQNFEIDDSSYSYRDMFNDENIEYHHTWMLSQIESKTINNLIISGVNISPYFYEEEIDHESLIIFFNSEVSYELFEELNKIKLEKNNEYFSVVREGINDTVVEMRFGQIIWSHDSTTDKVKFKATLVEKSYDKNSDNSFSLFDPEFYNMQDSIAENKETLYNLINILLEKDIISNAELEELKNISEERLYKRKLDFYKVKDLDKFLENK